MSINLKSELPKLLSLKRKAKIKDKVKHIMNAIEINKDMHSCYIYNELNLNKDKKENFIEKKI